MSTLLPVAGPDRVRRELGALVRRHRTRLSVTTGLYVLASVAGLAAPALLGRLVDGIVAGDVTASTVNGTVGVLALAVTVQAALTALATRSSLVLGEDVFAQTRERFITEVTRLPLSTVERAGTGDLVSRTTTDIDAISHTVRYAVPGVLIAAMSSLAILAAMVASSPLVALVVLVVMPPLVVSTRWYIRRAGRGYRDQMQAYAAVNGAVGETVDGARTVAALGLQGVRRAETDRRIGTAYATERYTLWLRTAWFPVCEFSYASLLALSLGWGGWLVLHGHASAGQVTSVTLYAVQLIYPVDEVLMRLDEFQVGATSLARVLGVGLVPGDRQEGAARPDEGQIAAQAVHYAYDRGPDVLHGIDLQLRPGERLAVVGPSGAGKSTLGRLLAGIHPPGAGSVTTGSPAASVPLVDLPVDELRRHVSLVTQEHHVFVGTLADNLRLARPEATDDGLVRALESVDAAQWVAALPDGLATIVGSGGRSLLPSQAQQVALARLVLADPRTLVLDEATSMLDPGAARHLERSLGAVLTGRTVVAVAHRLNTAHDADRVAVVEGGRVTELGTHDELLALNGSYAALWDAWRFPPTATATATAP